MTTPSVIIDLEPNWNDPPEVGYSFETVIQGTPYFLQQRRPLLPSPIRTLSCKYQFDRQQLQYARNLFLYGASKLCCIPIYSEPIQSNAVTQGASAIIASTDITYFWNIKNCSYIVIMDWVTGASEMVGITSVSGQTINLSSAIVNSWTAAQTIIYPAFAGNITAIRGLESSSLVGDVTAEFSEISIGEEATKAWVGLEEQTCIDQFNWAGVWTEVFPAGAGDQHWSFCTISKLGTVFLVGKVSGYLYVSVDGGASWSQVGPSASWYLGAISTTGQYMIAGTYTRLYSSSDYGSTWAEVRPAGNIDKWWIGVAIGTTAMIAVAAGGRAYKSSDGGANWTELTPLGSTNQSWYGCACSIDGQVIVLALGLTSLYVSRDGGTSWNETKPTGGATGTVWMVTFCSANGSVIGVALDPGSAYLSTDYGATWRMALPSGNYKGGVCNGSGKVIIFTTPVANMNLSDDYGSTWGITTPKFGATLGTVGLDSLGRRVIACSQRSFTGGVYIYYT